MSLMIGSCEHRVRIDGVAQSDATESRRQCPSDNGILDTSVDVIVVSAQMHKHVAA